MYYIYGDILDPNIIDAKTKSIVIPVNRCYDTAVDNDIISENSLHGQCFKKLYESQKYTPDTLYEAITKSLKEKHVCNITLENKRGHLNLYPEGSIAEVHFDEKTVLFLLALSAFRGDSTQTTKEEYFLSLSRLFERISERSQGMPVLIPLIGAGLSKTKLGDKILFQFIQDFILAHKDVIHCDIYIVLRSNLKYLIP
ncbi:MAG: DUF6430 domain-containing protein [Akkermansia sp.]|nr:DUF6430 domain-containing protein [Akkermansia sp.]